MICPMSWVQSMIIPPGAIDVDRAGFGNGTGAIVLDLMDCLGNETNLTLCTSTLPDVDSHSEDAGVRCMPGKKFIADFLIIPHLFL